MDDRSRMKCRKDAAEKMRQAVKSLKAAGDNGTAQRLMDLLARLDERRTADSKALGLF